MTSDPKAVGIANAIAMEAQEGVINRAVTPPSGSERMKQNEFLLTLLL